MRRKNRGYKKGEPFRDATLFVIACEGAKREKEYFQALAPRNQKIKIRILAPEKDGVGKSSPKWVVDRAIQYQKEYRLGKNDQLWLVMDVDRWPKEDLIAIGKQCEIERGWNIALSNPCFELWLILHVAEVDKSKLKNCKTLKKELNDLVTGGYNVKVFTGLIEDAIFRAQSLEKKLDYFLPGNMETKIHHLISELISLNENRH